MASKITKRMVKDTENDKWIDVNIRIQLNEEGKQEIIKTMSERYAKHLGWMVEEGFFSRFATSQGEMFLTNVSINGIKQYEIHIHPIGGKLSPRELGEKIDVFKEEINVIEKELSIDTSFAPSCPPFAHVILRQKILASDPQETMYSCSFDRLNLSCKLSRAIKLNLENPNLFKKLFETSLVDEYKKSIKEIHKITRELKYNPGTEEIVKNLNREEENVKLLEVNGMPKATPKKGVLRRIFLLES